ncbi:hypothetical protein [Planktothrix agardhii]|jgi:hypothetical protein|uniref:hypothetical protein n=1 Tax=Planktothrix agardhii TaxID=1160 RepID=UPI001D0B3CB6|nr:hypothetical protein [Planktothrix agardhii]MCB8788967.1 hypothetical protein [Planktothrix agardhii 1025]MCF3614308.1 hypothetical protein [Planktothrix agardhii 1027]
MKNEQRQFQGGNQIARIPKFSGLYAWYYKPLFVDINTLTQTLTSFLDNPGEIQTEINMRYGIRLIAESSLNAFYGSQNQSLAEIFSEAIQYGENFVTHFFKSEAVQLFTRPIYIGIAKNFYNRVYQQHYSSLVEMWDDNSRISKYLTLYPEITVKTVMNELNLSHSFALEARVRKIAPRDLMVHIFPTDNLPSEIGSDDEDTQSDTKYRRSLEKLLQIIADPICGRR